MMWIQLWSAVVAKQFLASWTLPTTLNMKNVHHNLFLGSAVMSMPFYVAITTPVIHYCTGGLEIEVDSVVVSSSGEAIPGYLNFAYYAEYEGSSPRFHPWLCRVVHALLCCNHHTSDPLLHGWLGNRTEFRTILMLTTMLYGGVGR